MNEDYKPHTLTEDVPLSTWLMLGFFVVAPTVYTVVALIGVG